MAGKREGSGKGNYMLDRATGTSGGKKGINGLSGPASSAIIKTPMQDASAYGPYNKKGNK